jgi:EthD domain-containing protein
MKTLALIARRPDLSRGEFRDHYEQIHAPLAVRTLLEGTTRYVRHHLRDTLFGRPAFDVVTAFWYRDAAAAAEIMRRTETPAGEAIRQDELTFMDKPANTFFAVTERAVRGTEDRAAALAAIALVRRPAGADAAAFHADFEAQHVPALLDATRAPAWCLQNRAQRFGSAEPAFDAVIQLHAAADTGLAQWAKELAATGANVVVVTVTEHESALPWNGGLRPLG